MTHYFLDTSAFVRLYVVEPGSERVKNMVRTAIASPSRCRVIVSELIHPEAVSALQQITHGPHAAKRGMSRLAAQRGLKDMTQDLGPASRLTVMSVSGLMEPAAQLVWKHRIRGADAVHLATAMLSRKGVRSGESFYFVSMDRKQNIAAAAEGFDVIDPTV